ncbi:hypothetical protein CK203_009050 [Vitis vinifera]|uniref:Uncharacterized protein n=1 Tax=Vitis vinifera TaxID=29760 RepID=A0A438K2L5_VITVI|nr:hypothetical protein CK203_009050 [Vitis vinifera]
MDGRTLSTNIDSWISRSCKRRPDRVSGRTLRWFCQPWLERIISWSFTREIFWLVMMPLGGDRVIITRGGTWAVTSCWNDVVRLAYFSQQSGQTYPDGICQLSGCDVCECRVPLPEEVWIGEARHVSSLGEIRMELTRIKMCARFHCSPRLKKMSANKEVASSSSSGDAHAEKSVDKLSVKEFRERFCIPNDVSVELTDGEVLMGCSILAMLFNLDLTLMEVLFIYSIKKVKNDIFSFVASLPSLQLVTSLPDSTKRAAKGHVLVKGLWTGLAMHPDRPFGPNQSLKVPGLDKRGKLVEWVEKTSFDRLNRLFEIAAAERSCETLLSTQNLRSVTQEPQPYVLNILPRRLPKKVVAGEHFVLKDLPFYAAMRKADARSRKARLNNREVKMQEGLLRKAPSGNNNKRARTPRLALYLKRLWTPRGSKPLGPSMSMAGRLALLAEEATSINQSDSPHPDVDEAGTSCAATLPPSAPPTEEMETESQGLPPYKPSPLALIPVKGSATRRSRPARDLKSGLIGRLPDHFLETIEVSCSSVQEDHSEGSETEMAEENPAAPVLVPDGGSPGETQPAKNDGAPDPEEESLSNAS